MAQQWAMMGGGFRAFAVDTGVVAAYMIWLRKENTLKKAFADTDMLSTVSGSTWFMSSLVYSQPFADMIEKMTANSGDNAGKIFGKEWTDKLLAINGGDNQLVQAIEKVLAAAGAEEAAGAIQDLIAVDAWAKQGLTWQNFVEIFMSATVGLTSDVQLGDASVRCTWSDGKIFLLNHCMITPSAPAQTKSTILWQEPCGPGKISYSTTSDEVLPRCVPAKFSVRLGSGEKAPTPYIPNEARALLGRLRYSALVADSFWCTCCPCPATVEADESGWIGKLESDAPQLSVIGCSAASSDAPGASAAYTKLPSYGCCRETVREGLVSHAVSSDASAAFSDAEGWLQALSKEGRVTHQALLACKENALRSVVDGGDADATGIAFAVGAGATRINAILNFGPDDAEGSYEFPLYLTNLFQGASNLKPNERLLLPVFKKPSAQEVQETYSGFVEYRGSKYLKGVRVGQFSAKTCQNKWFGISDDIDVQILVISVGTSVRQGKFVDFHDYDLLVQEIVDALGSGDDELLAMFRKPTAAEKPKDLTLAEKPQDPTVAKKPNVLLGSTAPVAKTRCGWKVRE